MEHLLKDSVLKALKKRIKEEEASARLYESMANWFEYQGYFGTAKQWQEYAREEWDHSQWVYKYLRDMGVKPEIGDVEAPEENFSSYVEIVKKSYTHEVDIAKSCNELATLCMKESDYLTLPLALKFTKEQVDEIAKIINILDELEAFGTDPKALRLLDDKLGKEIN